MSARPANVNDHPTLGPVSAVFKGWEPSALRAALACIAGLLAWKTGPDEAVACLIRVARTLPADTAAGPQHLTALEWRGWEAVACQHLAIRPAQARLLREMIRKRDPLSRHEMARLVAPGWISATEKGGAIGVHLSKLRRALELAGFKDVLSPVGGWTISRADAATIQAWVEARA